MFTYRNGISAIVNCMIKNLPSCVNIMICFAVTTTGIGLQPLLQDITVFHYGPPIISAIELLHRHLYKSIISKNCVNSKYYNEKNRNCDREGIILKKEEVRRGSCNSIRTWTHCSQCLELLNLKTQSRMNNMRKIQD